MFDNVFNFIDEYMYNKKNVQQNDKLEENNKPKEDNNKPIKNKIKVIMDDSSDEDDEYDEDDEDNEMFKKINRLFIKNSLLLDPLNFHIFFDTNHIKNSYYMNYEFDNENCTYEIDMSQQYKNDQFLMFQFIYNNYKSTLQLPTSEALFEIIEYHTLHNKEYIFLPLYVYNSNDKTYDDNCVLIFDLINMNIYLINDTDKNYNMLPLFETIMVKVCEDLEIFNIHFNYVPQCMWMNKKIIPFENINNWLDMVSLE